MNFRKNHSLSIFNRVAIFFGNLLRAIPCASLVAASAVYSSPLVHPPQQLPTELLGKWEVSEVHRNTQSSRTFQYGWNSPMLRWRIFDFNRSKIVNNTPEKSIPCKNPTAISKPVEVISTLNRILAHELSDTGSVAKDYELNFQEPQVVNFLHIHCSGEAWNGSIHSSQNGDEIFSDGSWLFFLSSNEIALRWYDETILILKRVPLNVRPSPSFSCINASLQSERAICKSHELSGLDRAVASAYSTLLNFTARENPEELKHVRDGQNKWLMIRNSCNSNNSCLADAMEQRISEINMPID